MRKGMNDDEQHDVARFNRHLGRGRAPHPRTFVERITHTGSERPCGRTPCHCGRLGHRPAEGSVPFRSSQYASAAARQVSMTAAPASRPRLLVVAGPNGAGKTTITERGLAHEWFHDCEYVNPDAIAQDELGDWNDPETV